jgi:hypothetical protein
VTKWDAFSILGTDEKKSDARDSERKGENQLAEMDD